MSERSTSQERRRPTSASERTTSLERRSATSASEPTDSLERRSTTGTSEGRVRVHRRTFLGSLGVVGGGSLAGCLGVLGSRIDDADNGRIVDWNERFVDAVQRYQEGNVAPVRRAAFLNVSMFDAVNAITGARGDPHYTPYRIEIDAAPPEASRPAAAIGAAFEVVTRFYHREFFEDVLQASLDDASDGEGDVAEGIEWGRTVATRLLEERQYDEVFTTEPYQACQNPANAPGCFRGNWIPEFAFVPPWTMHSREQFRPQGPPALDSQAYADDWHEVYEIGADTDDRPQRQVDQAAFWRGTAGSPRVPSMWNLVAQGFVREANRSILENARTFALLSLALADAGTSCWEAKYEYGFWRPRTAIREADRDGNPDTVVDPDWEPLSVGSSPEYSAGLATYGGAASRILVEEFDDDTPFSFGSTITTGLDGDAFGVSRSFDNLSHALEDSWMSRLYLGNHFRFALEDGARAGDELGSYIYDTVLRPVD